MNGSVIEEYRAGSATSDPGASRYSKSTCGLFAKAILIRSVEERLLELFSQGKLFGTVHTCIGQEWTGIAVAEQLREEDYIFSNHRCHGHFIARTDDVDGLIAEVMGKKSGVCGGRGGSQHLCDMGFFSNGVQGGILPVSAGLAAAQMFKQSKGITAAFIGDGTLGEGAVYETMNLASKWNLPLLIVLENNLYAQSTHQQQTLAGDICSRAAAFGIAAKHSSTWDPEELLSTAEWCVSTVRTERKPVFLRIDTFRLMAHSKGDDDRDPQEVHSYRERDPITRFFRSHPVEANDALAVATARIDAAVLSADQDSYATGSHESDSKSTVRNVSWAPTVIATSDRTVALIRGALDRALQENPRVVVIGEDIESPYGGAFKVTKGLSETHAGRVRNMPISEALIVGMGNGLALAKMIPVCEIMFGDFLTLCADQLVNHSSKFRYMYNDQVTVPLIVRTPMGGRRGYGPTHSQSIEKHFLGLPDIRVLAVHHRHDPGLIYDRLFETIQQPTLVIENKVLYGQRATDEMPDGFVLECSDEPFPTTRIRPEGRPDVTIVCYGQMLKEVEDAIVQVFDEHEITCEVICPTQLCPLNAIPIVESIADSHRLLVVEEGVGFAAFGSEVIAQIAEISIGVMHQVRRLASPDHPIPACAPLEKSLLVNTEAIVRVLVEMMSHD